jgi:hypothetical protein
VTFAEAEHALQAGESVTRWEHCYIRLIGDGHEGYSLWRWQDGIVAPYRLDDADINSTNWRLK